MYLHGSTADPEFKADNRREICWCRSPKKRAGAGRLAGGDGHAPVVAENPQPALPLAAACLGEGGVMDAGASNARVARHVKSIR